MRLVIAIVAALSASAECIRVESDRILASDLAKAVPEFAGIAPETAFGFAPQPGLERMITAAELRRFAGSHNVAFDRDSGVCVEFAVQPLTGAAVADAVRAGFGDPAAELEVVEFSHVGVPRGVLEFKRSDLVLPPMPKPDAVLWRGRVQYSERRSATVWAKVRISVPVQEVVAVSALRAGRVIAPADVRIEERRVPASSLRAISDPALVTGRTAVRDIPAGTAVQSAWLRAPQAIKAGDEVAVQVVNGGAALKFVARATGSARVGDSVLLVNPASGKRFAAVVEGPGAALVNVTGRRK